jgi:hypothetical protein
MVFKEINAAQDTCNGAFADEESKVAGQGHIDD